MGISLRSIWVVLAAAAIVGLAWRLPFLSDPDSSNPGHINAADTLDRGLNGEPESLDPKNFHSNQASAILRDIGEGLTRYDPTGNVSGGVASEWSSSSDGRIYTFQLRENARWSTGEAVSAHDFVRAFQTLVDPKNAAKNALVISLIRNARQIVSGDVAVSELGIRSEGPTTLVIELGKAAPQFLQVLTHPSAYPRYERQDSETPVEFPMVSNGAYKLSNRVLGSAVELVRNGSYWNAENVKFDKVRYHIVEESIEFSRFKAKELDITGNVPSSVFEIAKAQFPKELRIAPYLGVYYYGFNLRDGALADNSALRRALNLAIDREVLAEKVLGRGELPAFSWVPPGLLNYEPVKFDWHEISNEERIAMARRLLDESGYLSNSSKPLTLYFNSSDVQERIALAVQSMWKETLGIQVELVNLEFRVLVSSIATNADIDIFRLSWTADYNDPESFLQLFQSDDPTNYTGYRNMRFDMLMRKASDAASATERARILRDAEKILFEDVPVVPLYFYVSKHLVSKDVVGWTSNILDIHESQFLAPLD